MRTMGTECGVFALSFIGSAALTYPLIRHLLDLTGADNSSQMLWNFWWTREALLYRHCNPFYTPMLFHPGGAGLAFHTFSLFSCLALAPVSFLLDGVYGLLLAYRMQILLAFALTCYCTYRLVVCTTGNRAAGFLAGLFFAFRSFHLVHSGYPHINSMYWAPLYAMSLQRLLDCDTKASKWRLFGRAAICAIVFAGATYTSTEYALFLFCFAVVFIGWHLAARASRWRATLMSSCASHVIAAVLIVPLLSAMHWEHRRGDLYRPSLDQDVVFSADLASFVLPSGRHFLLGKLTGELEERVNHRIRGNDVFLGYVGLCLFAVSIAVLKRKAWSVWSLSAIVFFALSLGPYLQAGGTTYRGFWLPYLAFKKLPLMGLFRTPVRFQSMFLFSAAMVIGLGFAAALRTSLAQKLSKRTRRTGYLLLALSLAYECKYRSEPPRPAELPRIPRVYDFIAEQPDDVAVMELPTGSRACYPFERQYMAYQAVHRKRLYNGSLSRKPYPPQPNLAEAYSLGIRLVLVHEKFYRTPTDFYRQCAGVERFADFLWFQDGIALLRVRRP